MYQFLYNLKQWSLWCSACPPFLWTPLCSILKKLTVHWGVKYCPKSFVNLFHCGTLCLLVFENRHTISLWCGDVSFSSSESLEKQSVKKNDLRASWDMNLYIQQEVSWMTGCISNGTFPWAASFHCGFRMDFNRQKKWLIPEEWSCWAARHKLKR